MKDKVFRFFSIQKLSVTENIEHEVFWQNSWPATKLIKKKKCMQVKKSTKLASDFHFYFNNDGIFVIPHQNDSQRNSLIIVVLVV